MPISPKLVVDIYRGIIIPGFIRWCRISSIHSRGPKPAGLCQVPETTRKPPIFCGSLHFRLDLILSLAKKRNNKNEVLGQVLEEAVQGSQLLYSDGAPLHFFDEVCLLGAPVPAHACLASNRERKGQKESHDFGGPDANANVDTYPYGRRPTIHRPDRRSEGKM